MQSPHKAGSAVKIRGNGAEQKWSQGAIWAKKNSLPIQFHGGTILTGCVLFYDC